MLPPGDIRNCLVALADDESLLGRLFQHRFAEGDLTGHSFGNLFLAALSEVTGAFDLAIQECSRVLKINGRVLPSTLTEVSLRAERADGSVVAGRARSPRGRPLPAGLAGARAAGARAGTRGDPRRRPGRARARQPLHQRAAAHGRAGPGRGDRDRPGPPAYICNVMTQPGETDGFDAGDHLDRVLEALPGGVDVVVVHQGPLDPEIVAAYGAEGQEPVRADPPGWPARGSASWPPTWPRSGPRCGIRRSLWPASCSISSSVGRGGTGRSANGSPVTGATNLYRP